MYHAEIQYIENVELVQYYRYFRDVW